MALYTELRNLGFAELTNRFKAPCPEGPRYAATYRIEIAILIRKCGEEGIKFLRQQLGDESASKVRAAIFALSGKGPGQLEVGSLLLLLKDKRSAVVAETIDSLTRVRYNKALRRIRSLFSASSPLVVGAVLRHVSKLDPRGAKNLLLRGLKHSHFIVRENACDELDSLRFSGAVPHLEPLKSDRHEDVRLAARTAIANLRSSGR